MVHVQDNKNLKTENTTQTVIIYEMDEARHNIEIIIDAAAAAAAAAAAILNATHTL